MMKKCLMSVSICLISMMMLSCTGKHSGYKRTPSGLLYKFHSKNPSAVQPKETDFLKVNMACYLDNTLYFDWQNTGNEVFAQLKKSSFPGDLQEAYSMMHVGDSASFIIKADSIAIKYYDQNPDSVGLKADDYFRYEVKLLEVQTEETFRGNIEKMKETMLEQSRKALADYVAYNNIIVTPEPSGVYVIPLEKGKGRCPVKGERVDIDFSASLLDGTLVGSTFDKQESFSFVLGDNYVIPAWEEVVPKIHLGDRVKIIVPCEMAYGEHSVGSIPSYSNLIYEIKLLRITTVDELKAEEEQALALMKESSEKAFFEYLETNKIIDHTASGLYYSKSIVTEGEQAVVGKIAHITFEASYLDGTVFGDSDQLGGRYEVLVGKGKVIRGLDEAITLMRVGEKARFVLPYTLAYGASAYNNIPPFSNLVFDVELLDLVDENKN